MHHFTLDRILHAYETFGKAATIGLLRSLLRCSHLRPHAEHEAARDVTVVGG
jgi:hypothetical protein